MIPLGDLLAELRYDISPHYRSTDGPLNPETAHLFRAARQVGISGIYVFDASPRGEHFSVPVRPAVYVAEAEDEASGRRIHRNLWNLGRAPFLILKLPREIRVYTGFDYLPDEERAGWLDTVSTVTELRDRLGSFSADSVDTGQIWKSRYAESLGSSGRVDTRLLRNLERLGQGLEENGLQIEVAHALIGKYVYLRYLRDRNILSDEWLGKRGIDPDRVFKHDATVAELRAIVDALEDRFNGKVFPIDFDKAATLKDYHVSWVASVFYGAEVIETAPDLIRQLHLPFKAYEFQYIPVETLSAIYQQFISERKEKGAVYTPEVLADYVLCQVEAAKPLESGARILDPACGSGVFLVLAYRRLIETQISRSGRKPTPEELRATLLHSIYGVERERDACFVAEFSLILTLLHYLEPRDLQLLNFQFPSLHNKQIFECDFFDLDGEGGEGNFWHQGLTFDWIVGNPPWIELKPDETDQPFVRRWMADPRNKRERPIAGNRLAEAFSWLVPDLLKADGVAGLLLPATSLFNHESELYRQKFFAKHEVLRVTNFANLRDVLFDEPNKLPAMSMVYRVAPDMNPKSSIVHTAPFCINQIREAGSRPWVITINEGEIQTLSPYQADLPQTSFWKLAMWGTYRDQKAIERIRYLFPTNLGEISQKRGWPAFSQGSELRDPAHSSEDLEYLPELRGKKRFDSRRMQKSLLRFSVPDSLLLELPDNMCYVRKQGGKKGLTTSEGPHLILSPDWMSYAVYSDRDFVIPPRSIGIAADRGDAPYLRALAIYLNSSLVAYYLFFHVPEWGVFRRARRVTISDVKALPTPEFSTRQVEHLANLHYRLLEAERQQLGRFLEQESLRPFPQFAAARVVPPDVALHELPGALRARTKTFVADLRTRLRSRIDDEVFELFGVPDSVRLLVDDLVNVRLLLDKASTRKEATRRATHQELTGYARVLKEALDDFVTDATSHRVAIAYSDELVECLVEPMDGRLPASLGGISVTRADSKRADVLSDLSALTRERISQWAYVQRTLRLFDGPRIYMYKGPRLIDWTRTQAMIDAGEMIGEVISARKRAREDH